MYEIFAGNCGSDEHFSIVAFGLELQHAHAPSHAFVFGDNLFVGWIFSFSIHSQKSLERVSLDGTIPIGTLLPGRDMEFVVVRPGLAMIGLPTPYRAGSDILVKHYRPARPLYHLMFGKLTHCMRKNTFFDMGAFFFHFFY